MPSQRGNNNNGQGGYSFSEPITDQKKKDRPRGNELGLLRSKIPTLDWGHQSSCTTTPFISQKPFLPALLLVSFSLLFLSLSLLSFLSPLLPWIRITIWLHAPTQSYHREGSHHHPHNVKVIYPTTITITINGSSAWVASLVEEAVHLQAHVIQAAWPPWRHCHPTHHLLAYLAHHPPLSTTTTLINTISNTTRIRFPKINSILSTISITTTWTMDWLVRISTSSSSSSFLSTDSFSSFWLKKIRNSGIVIEKRLCINYMLLNVPISNHSTCYWTSFSILYAKMPSSHPSSSSVWRKWFAQSVRFDGSLATLMRLSRPSGIF